MNDTLYWSLSVPDGSGGGYSHGMAIVENRLFVGAGSRLMAVNLLNGTVMWTFVADRGRVTTHPLVHHGNVYFGVSWGDGRFYAVNITDGREVWRRQVGDIYTTSPVGVGDLIHVPTNDKGIHALDVVDGTIQWSSDCPTYMHSSPAYHDGLLFVHGKSQLRALNVTGQRTEWTVDTAGAGGSSVVHSGGRLLLHTSGVVECFEATNGTRSWRTEIDEHTWNAVESTPAVAFDRVYVGTQGTNTLHCLDLRTGERLWSQRFGGDLISSPVISRNGVVYVISDAICAVDAFTGSKLWSRMLSSGAGNCPILAQGCLAICDSKTLYCFGKYIQDNELPQLSVIFPTEGACLNSSRLNVSGIATDDHEIDTVEMSDDGLVWRTLNGTDAWSGDALLVPGPNTLHFRVTDLSGKTDIKKVNFTFDPSPPRGAFEFPTEGCLVSDAVLKVRGTACDDVAIRKVEVGLNRKNWIPCQGRESWAANLTLGDGNGTIYLRITDAASNTFDTSINITVDTKKPMLEVLEPPQGRTLPNLPVKVSGTSFDEHGLRIVEASPDGVNWTPCEGSPIWTACILLERGLNTVHIRAIDLAGNVAWCNVTLKVQPQGEPNPVEPWWPYPALPLSALIAVAIAMVLALTRWGNRPRPPPGTTSTACAHSEDELHPAASPPDTVPPSEGNGADAPMAAHRASSSSEAGPSPPIAGPDVPSDGISSETSSPSEETSIHPSNPAADRAASAERQGRA